MGTSFAAVILFVSGLVASEAAAAEPSPSAASPTESPGTDESVAGESATDASAQVVHLRDGSIVRGTVGSTTAETIIVETKNGVLTIPRAEVVRIEFEGATFPEPSSTPAPEPAQPSASDPALWEAPPAARAAPAPRPRWSGYVNLFLGNRSMDPDWDPVESQAQVALETTFRPPDWALGLAVDLTSSYASGEVTDDPELEGVTFEGSTSEFDIGVRYVTEATRGIAPVSIAFGGGLSSMSATFAGESDGLRLEDSGSGGGYWLSFGMHLRLAKHFNVGGSLRFSSAEVEVFEVRSNAGGFQAGLTLGVSFGFPEIAR